MKGIILTAMIVATGLAGCAGQDEAKDPATTLPIDLRTKYSFDDIVPPGSVRFIVLGDVGTGKEGHQDEVAAGIVKVCKQTGCDFAIVAGDNIYNSGVRNEYDPQFESKFEEPYRDVDMPFYLVSGNHDNGGGGGTNPAVADYQVLYSQRVDRTSDKWNMPGRYYRVTIGNVTITGIDSGPAEVTVSPVWTPGARGDIMQAWLAAETPKITTPWKFALAHHPYWSNGPHGDAGAYDNAAGRGLWYKRLLEAEICGKYDVFFAGHDHNMQWLQRTDACARTELIVNGASGASLYAKRVAGAHPAHFEDYSHYGFVWVDITGNTFTGAFYDEDGNKLYERSFTKS